MVQQRRLSQSEKRLVERFLAGETFSVYGGSFNSKIRDDGVHYLEVGATTLMYFNPDDLLLHFQYDITHLGYSSIYTFTPSSEIEWVQKISDYLNITTVSYDTKEIGRQSYGHISLWLGLSMGYIGYEMRGTLDEVAPPLVIPMTSVGDSLTSADDDAGEIHPLSMDPTTTEFQLKRRLRIYIQTVMHMSPDDLDPYYQLIASGILEKWAGPRARERITNMMIPTAIRFIQNVTASSNMDREGRALTGVFAIRDVFFQGWTELFDAAIEEDPNLLSPESIGNDISRTLFGKPLINIDSSQLQSLLHAVVRVLPKWLNKYRDNILIGIQEAHIREQNRRIAETLPIQDAARIASFSRHLPEVSLGNIYQNPHVVEHIENRFQMTILHMRRVFSQLLLDYARHYIMGSSYFDRNDKGIEIFPNNQRLSVKDDLWSLASMMTQRDSIDMSVGQEIERVMEFLETSEIVGPRLRELLGLTTEQMMTDIFVPTIEAINRLHKEWLDEWIDRHHDHTRESFLRYLADGVSDGTTNVIQNWYPDRTRALVKKFYGIDIVLPASRNRVL
jgi:hypothetical protein